MNNEEKLEYSRLIPIEKQVALNILNGAEPSEGVIDVKAAENLIEKFHILNLDNPFYSVTTRPYGSEENAKCVYAYAIDKELEQKISTLGHYFDPGHQEKWKESYLDRCKTQDEVKPLVGVDVEYSNIPWHNPLDSEEESFIENSVPRKFILPYDESNRFDYLDNALMSKFEAFLATRNGEVDEDKLYCMTDLGRNKVLYYGNMKLRDFEAGDPVLSFGKWDEKSQSWEAILDLSQLNEDDRKEVAETLKKLPEKLNEEKGFKGAKEDELFWSERVEAPINRTLEALKQPGGVVSIRVKESDMNISQALERNLKENALERWNVKEAEMNHTADVLTPENRRAYEVLQKAYVSTEELNNHPRLQKAFEKELLTLFINAQNKGMGIQLNQYSIDAPSRNHTEIQVKQPSREKEK